MRVDWETARRAALKRAEEKCQLCGINIWELLVAMSKTSPWKNKYTSHSYEVDHIIPVVEGGDNEPENLRVLCIFCHKEETAKLKRRLSKINKKC